MFSSVHRSTFYRQSRPCKKTNSVDKLLMISCSLPGPCSVSLRLHDDGDLGSGGVRALILIEEDFISVHLFLNIMIYTYASRSSDSEDENVVWSC